MNNDKLQELAAKQNLAEVRAAAEIVRYWLSHPDAGEPTMEEQEERGHAAQDIADFILSHIPADAELPVTAEWLREEWGWDSYGTASMHYDRDEFTSLCWSDDGLSFVAKTYKMRCYTKGFPVTTRHQFRQLAGALGIQPKKEAV